MLGAFTTTAAWPLFKFADPRPARPETAAASGFSSAPLKGLRVLEAIDGTKLAHGGAAIGVTSWVRNQREYTGHSVNLWV